VGSTFKERVIEFFLAVSGSLFYHLILRPINYRKSRKKEKVNSRTATKEVAGKNFSPSSPSRIEID
jgi:hypothetical protein